PPAALTGGAFALDVREPDEFAAGHIEGALHVPLGQLPARAAEVPHGREIVVYCGHGERAATGVSLLERRGLLHPLANLNGGLDAWRSASLPVTLPGEDR
ncbi:MAG: rhodanese-like domain-containing protein, partial [Dehalococcoidia bacterium]